MGKSHVANLLRELGCLVVDADQTARDVVAPDSEGLERVVAEFGKEVLRPDGTLDRATLGAIVFADEAKRKQLNAILHPLIIAAQDELLRGWERDHPEGIGVVDAALMIESGGYRRFDKIVVVHCEPEQQVKRLMTRNHLAREEALARIRAQMPQAEKMRYADFLIDTSGDYEATRARTHAVYEELKALSHAQVVKKIFDFRFCDFGLEWIAQDLKSEQASVSSIVSIQNLQSQNRKFCYEAKTDKNPEQKVCEVARACGGVCVARHVLDRRGLFSGSRGRAVLRSRQRPARAGVSLEQWRRAANL